MRSLGRVNRLVHALAVLGLIFAGPAIAGDGGAATIDELIEQCSGVTSFAELLPMVHPDDQPMLGMAVQMMTAFAPMMAMPSEMNSENEAEANALVEKMSAEAEALEAKYGLKVPPEDAPSGETPEGMAMRARYTFDGVDLAAYITAAEEWLASSVGEETLKGGPVPDFSQVENIEIDGDLATATVEGRPVEFIRDEGRWYLRVQM